MQSTAHRHECITQAMILLSKSHYDSQFTLHLLHGHTPSVPRNGLFLMAITAQAYYGMHMAPGSDCQDEGYVGLLLFMIIWAPVEMLDIIAYTLTCTCWLYATGYIAAFRVEGEVNTCGSVIINYKHYLISVTTRKAGSHVLYSLTLKSAHALLYGVLGYYYVCIGIASYV